MFLFILLVILLIIFSCLFTIYVAISFDNPFPISIEGVVTSILINLSSIISKSISSWRISLCSLWTKAIFNSRTNSFALSIKMICSLLSPELYLPISIVEVEIKADGLKRVMNKAKIVKNRVVAIINFFEAINWLIISFKSISPAW